MKKGLLIAILVIVIVVIFLVLVGGFIYLQFTQEPYIPDNSYLKINLIGQIQDSDDLSFSSTLTIRDLWYHIQRAKIDPRIKGIILKISYLSGGLAKLTDLGKIIQDFRTSGKKVYAYLIYGGLGEYYLATFADKVYAFKDGDLFLRGLAAEAVFLKETLSKIGIKADFLYLGKYKTAAHTFMEKEMTPPHRESLKKLLDDLHETTIAGIAQNRKMDINQVKEIVEKSPVTVRAYKEAKLIDKAIYEDEILEGISKNHKIVSFSTYKQTSSPRPYRGDKRIAVIFADGEIASGSSGKQGIYKTKILGSHTLIKELQSARSNPAIKAVVLRIDSPGGSSVASNSILRETYLLRKKKPLIISMSDLAASGGYLISLQSSKILAHPQTITGSIGVLGGKFILKDLYDKIGMNKQILKTSTYADMFTDYKGFTAGERKKLLQIMTAIYHSFLEKVANHRKMPLEEVEKVAQGRVWAGSTAKDLKLVDKLGGLMDAITDAKKMAKIPDSESIGITIYPKQKSIIQLLVESLSKPASIPLMMQLKNLVTHYRSSFPALILPFQISIK